MDLLRYLYAHGPVSGIGLGMPLSSGNKLVFISEERLALFFARLFFS